GTAAFRPSCSPRWTSTTRTTVDSPARSAAWSRSARNRATNCFWRSVRRWRPASSAAAVPEANREDGSVRILYVEDNDDNVFVLKNRLQRAGHVVLVATDGEQGIAAALEQLPDLVIMD